mmetsp:Transcript_17042/g.48422  ORF Transcript_17042/g.48422 Transcript_17042/m.48422 type:complete len:271 (-) Transcript_17042:158-970(-)
MPAVTRGELDQVVGRDPDLFPLRTSISRRADKPTVLRRPRVACLRPGARVQAFGSVEGSELRGALELRLERRFLKLGGIHARLVNLALGLLAFGRRLFLLLLLLLLLFLLLAAAVRCRGRALVRGGDPLALLDLHRRGGERVELREQVLRGAVVVLHCLRRDLVHGFGQGGCLAVQPRDFHVVVPPRALRLLALAAGAPSALLHLLETILQILDAVHGVAEARAALPGQISAIAVLPDGLCPLILGKQAAELRLRRPLIQGADTTQWRRR